MIRKRPSNMLFDTVGRHVFAALMGSVCAQPAMAGPSGGVVAGGTGHITGQGTSHVTVNQSSSRLVIDWADLNVAAHERLDFVQPGANAIALNRVHSGLPTQILGQVRADGRVVIMNQNGVMFGKSARIDVGGLVATTAHIDTDRFMHDVNPVFDTAGRADAKIINSGHITARDAGLVGFVAPHVENDGVITADVGRVELHSGSTFTLDLAGDGLVNIAVADDVAKQIAQNSGVIDADTIVVSAADARRAVDALVVNTGTLEASSVQTRGGKIILGGTGAQVVAEGQIKANGQNGGDIAVTGRAVMTNGVMTAIGTGGRGGNVSVVAQTTSDAASGTMIDVSGVDGGAIVHAASGSISSGIYRATGHTGRGGSIDWGGSVSLMSATLDVSGHAAGGVVRMGGVWQNPSSSGRDVNGVHLAASQNIVASSSTKILAGGMGSHASGGEIVLRAQADAFFAGHIDTRGGAVSGAGGRAEISGATIRLADGYAVMTGHTGRAGTLLLDPQNITITNAANIDAVEMIKLGHQYAFANSDVFGFASALNNAGNILAVGAFGDDTGGGNRGAVYLFGLDPSDSRYSPVFARKIAHGTSGLNITNNSQFGISVSLNGAGNILAVGSNTDDTGGTDRGAVYIMGLNTSNLSAVPTLHRKLASGVDGIVLANGVNFGVSVALNDAGNMLAVGSHLDDTGGTDRGAVHIIGLNTGNLSGASTYGIKLASGVGGLGLINSDYFGYSVAFNGLGNILAVGAQRDNTGGTDRGAVYLFNMNPVNVAAIPTQAYKLHALSGAPIMANSDYFGSSVSLNAAGDILAVGAVLDDTGGTDRGAVYMFNLDPMNLSGAPVFRKKIAHGVSGVTLTNNTQFGSSVALNGAGDMLAVGAARDDTGGTDRGTVFLFDVDETNLALDPVQRNRLHNSNPGVNITNSTRFGITSALNGAGNIMAVGAYLDDTGGTDRGAVYLFNVDPTYVGRSPVFRYKVAHGAGATLINGDNFGISVSLNDAGNMLAVGAHNDDTGGANRGAAYVFSLNTADIGAGVTLRQKIANGTGGLALANSNQFGISLDLNGAGNILAVGASGDDTGGTDRGAVYIVGLNPLSLGTTAVIHKKISEVTPGINLANADGFGRAVALNSAGDVLAVGASGDDTGGINRGAVHMMRLDTGNLAADPVYGTKITHLVGGLSLNNNDAFGIDLDINGAGNLLVVGAYFDDTGGTDRGAAYMFTLDPASLSTVPTLWRKIASGSGVSLANGDGFGLGIALNAAGNIMAIGAYNDDTGGADRGAMRLFNVTGLLGVNNQTYGANASQNVVFTPAMLAALLNSGNNVTLQANNDITVASALTLNNPSGHAGTLTLQAGRSVMINDDIVTDNGDLIVIANDDLANGVIDMYRLSGAAMITMSGGASVNAGTGSAQFIMRRGVGKTFSDSGNITLDNVTAGTVIAETQADIFVNGAVTANATGNALVLAAGGAFHNNAGAGALVTPNGRYLVYSAHPSLNNLGGLTGFSKRYGTTYAAQPPASIGGANNMMLYGVSPVLTVAAQNETRNFGQSNPTLSYTVSGFIDGDDAVSALVGAPIIATAAGQSAIPGPYAIQVTSGTLSSPLNYTIQYVDATLTVTNVGFNTDYRLFSIPRARTAGIDVPGPVDRLFMIEYGDMEPSVGVTSSSESPVTLPEEIMMRLSTSCLYSVVGEGGGFGMCFSGV